MTQVTVAPITSRAKRLPTEVLVSHTNVRQIRWLLPDQEAALTRAIGYAFDLYGGFGSSPRGWGLVT